MSISLPQEVSLKYDDWPRKGQTMQFRLVYQGRLPAASGSNRRADAKHEIRRQFHPQLKALWNSHPFLSTYISTMVDADPPGSDAIPYVERIANIYARCRHRFVPLVGDFFGNGPGTLACALSILFLRADQSPGAIVKDGGDIDNRIKVLLDALQLPVSCEDIPSTPGTGEDPFFCLLQDDKLITEINIVTDRLLATPTPASTHPEQDVHLVIHVKTQVLGASGFTAFMT